MRSLAFRMKYSNPFSGRPFSDSWEKRSHLKGCARRQCSRTTAWERGQLLLQDRWISIRKTVTTKGEVDLYRLSVEDAGCRVRHIGECRVEVEPRVVAYGQIA